MRIMTENHRLILLVSGTGCGKGEGPLQGKGWSVCLAIGRAAEGRGPDQSKDGAPSTGVP